MGGYTIREAWAKLVEVWEDRESKRLVKLLIQKQDYEDALQLSIRDIRHELFIAQHRISHLERQLAQKYASETIISVTEWANTTFGRATIKAMMDRARKEWDELLDLFHPPDHTECCIPKKVAEEAADVCICLYRVIGTLDPEAINKKMAKNRARKWKVDASGTAQHVGEE